MIVGVRVLTIINYYYVPFDQGFGKQRHFSVPQMFKMSGELFYSRHVPSIEWPLFPGRFLDCEDSIFYFSVFFIVLKYY